MRGYKPSYRLQVNGNDITPQVSGRLVNLTLTDERGDKADQLDIVISDHDGRVPIPPSGAEIQVWIGWDGDLTYKGKYLLDEASLSGPPDILTVRARSADFVSPLKQKRQESWHKTTLGGILGIVAARSGLMPVLHADLANVVIEHIDQTDESDHNLLLRLGQRYDALHAIKDGRLLFSPAGSGQTAEGQPVPGITLHRQDGDTHHFSRSDRPNRYTGVQAHWHDTETGEQKTETAGTEDVTKVLRHSHTYSSQEEAMLAATAELRALNRALSKLTINRAKGEATLKPETAVTVRGYKPDIDGADWIIVRLAHSLNESGFTTKVEMEVKG
ncbi:contractile injection system protein, VgrG/Pvc8 family [Marinobacterium iners]|uniref:Phage protein D n=1 Tax=Marinobacterium iners DSM 11526 TaxID=1122198 RepID=A0A1H3ZXS3_9GAMM|nr:contractile injection system protein, VgrG/Pvc8 family [Marinobacterium iners]SEA28563.1 hypothetical protein SAMN02745729_102207 [Marinobacterium iners DSM 11526]